MTCAVKREMHTFREAKRVLLYPLYCFMYPFIYPHVCFYMVSDEEFAFLYDINTSKNRDLNIGFTNLRWLLCGRILVSEKNIPRLVTVLQLPYEMHCDLCNYLRILTGKKHPKIKLQRLRKIRILTFGSLLHQINSFQEVLKLEQIF